MPNGPVAGTHVRITRPGAPDVLTLEPCETPPPGPGQLRVTVAAAGLNRADLLQRRGLYPAPPGSPADVPGLEYAGIVLDVGPGTRDFAPGDRVMGIVGGGAMATHLVVHEREAMPVPANLDLVAAAAIPEAFLTAFDTLFLQAALRPFETVLLHAVSSGVGTAALQLARAAGARVIGTSRTAAKLQRCATLGLAESVLPDAGRFADAVRALAPTGVDVILDPVGGPTVEENLRALAERGRLVVIGSMGGASSTFPLGLLMSRRAQLIGTVLRARPLEEKATLARRFSREVLPRFADGRLQPVVGDLLPMTTIVDAHSRMEANDTFGKVVLTW